MSKTKKLMMTCVGVLMLAAFATAPAMGQWMVNGKTLSSTESKSLATTAKVDKEAVLIAGSVTVKCTGQLEGASPTLEGSSEMGSAASLTFTGCTAAAPCTVTSSISTLPLLALIELAEAGNKDKALILFDPQTKATFAVITFGGETCALLGAQPVKGKAKALAPTGGLENALQLLEAETNSSELVVGSSPASLSGSALLQLPTHEPWSFLLP